MLWRKAHVQDDDSITGATQGLKGGGEGRASTWSTATQNDMAGCTKRTESGTGTYNVAPSLSGTYTYISVNGRDDDLIKSI